MGDLSVSIAAELVKLMLESLQQVISDQAHLISNAKKQMEEMEKKTAMLKDFLVDSTKFPAKDIVITSLLRNIREAVYEAEDVVDTFISSVQGKNLLIRSVSIPLRLNSLAKQVQTVGLKVSGLCDDVKAHIESTRGNIDKTPLNNIADLEEYDHEAPSPGEDNNMMVGFENEKRQLIGYLTTETQQLDVICITGMPGIGKTTLAAKIFHHPTIQDKEKFSKRIWVSVSNATTRKVLLSILRKLGHEVKKGIHHKSNEDLGRLVAGHLEHEKFLVVMDDVWTASDWRNIGICFPKGHKMGKVLITSCHEEVARVTVNPGRPHVKLRTLSPEEGWRLLQLRVFGDRKCPEELESSGKLIVEQCGRLPMAIVDIADILIKKVPESHAWEQVCDSMSTCLNDDPTISGTNKLMSSYDKLPYHLRACFLYLGMFPEGYDIQVSTLIQMWIAEGFVQYKDGLSLEETAGNYLDDLISRSLVIVVKQKLNGRPKTCRIQYRLRHFCKNEAGKEKENFLQELKKSSSDGAFHPPITEIEKYRRLCIYSNVLDFISLKPSGCRVRSFACFSGIPITLKKKNASTIPAAFKLLRVMDVKPITFTQIPDGLYLLVHLRYITLSLDLPILPSHFSKLRNIQTLTVYTTSKTLEIKADILKMIQLRHFKTNVSATLPKTSKSSEGGEKLQTLRTISPISCTQEFFGRVHNLNKLSVLGQLALLLDGEDKSFHFAKLCNLKKLKLINDMRSEGISHKLPPKNRFPGNLKRLTISSTSLEWSNMSILGSLDQLEVLKLRDNAFVGTTWKTTDGGFCCLQYLHIESNDLVVWQASRKHFPKLKHLELRNCEKLREVPFELAHIQTFERLHLRKSTSATDSAKRILTEKRKQEAEETNKVRVFEFLEINDT